MANIDAHNTTRRDMCFELPPQVNSNGFWSYNINDSEGLLKNSMPELELQMIMIFFMSQTFHFILKRFGITRLSSEIITGLFLAYILSDEHGNPINDKLLTPSGQHIIGTLSVFGYTLFLFLIAVKMNVGMVLKSGTKAATIGVAALIVPFSCGMMSYKVVGNGLGPADRDHIPFVFITQSLVTFPVIATLITELNLLNSELGRLSLSAAMVGDVFSAVLSNIFNLIKVFFDSAQRAFVDVAATFSFFLAVVFVFRPIMLWIVKKTPEGQPVRDRYVYSIIVLALAAALYSNMFDEQVFMGPYVLGLAIPDGPPLGSAIVGKLDCFVSGVFLPLFVATCVLRVDFSKTKFDAVMRTETVMVVMMYVAKFVACLTSCFFYKMPRHDSLALSFIMTSKGIVEIAIYTYFRDNNRLDEGTYNLLIYSIIAISIIVPVSVKLLYDPSRKYAGYQKRNLMHMKPNSELRILTCIHKHEDIAAMIDILDASCPTLENPVGVYVLHLIELIGRATPIFITHQAQKTSLQSVSYSQNVILSFARFENNYWGSVKVSAFTAVSPYKLMHEDICTLALDKLVSLVVLPFHRKWSADGAVEFDDTMGRALNSSVLERAPCSVAILVNRGFSGRASSAVAASASSQDAYMYTVCVVFLGGKDDREALTFAKRMSRESCISLTVVHFVTPDEAVEEGGQGDGDGDGGEDDRKWKNAMDTEVLKDVRHFALSAHRHATYVEEVVKDGSEMAPLVKGMVDEYDLIITGRSHAVDCCQMSGLDLTWTEFPELGVIGDLLASKDIYGKASVLVVQQQDTDD